MTAAFSSRSLMGISGSTGNSMTGLAKTGTTSTSGRVWTTTGAAWIVDISADGVTMTLVSASIFDGTFTSCGWTAMAVSMSTIAGNDLSSWTATLCLSSRTAGTMAGSTGTTEVLPSTC